jgi:hypothetical protein
LAGDQAGANSATCADGHTESIEEATAIHCDWLMHDYLPGFASNVRTIVPSRFAV